MRKSWITLSIVVLFLSTDAQATGFSKPVWGGARAIGLGGAFVGLADDATALWHNPAGITYLDGNHHLYLGADALITDTDYTPAGGTKESAETEFLPVPSFAYINNSMKVLSFGVGVFFPHGNGGKFGSASANPVGNPIEGRIYSMEILPTFAWQVTPVVSFGASLRIVRISNKLEGFTFINPVTLTPVDVVTELSVNGWSFGGAFGMMIKPNEWLRFGVNYRTQIKDTLKGDGTFQTLGAFDATLSQTLPTLITAGFSAQATKFLLFSFAYGWERNGELQTTDVTTTITGLENASLPQGWKSSHTFHFGTEIKPSDRFHILAGYAKDFNASIPDTVNNRVTGDVAAHEVSFGLGVNFTDKINSTLSWNGRFGDRTVPVTATNIAPGEISAFVHTLSLGLGLNL